MSFALNQKVEDYGAEVIPNQIILTCITMLCVLARPV